MTRLTGTRDPKVTPAALASGTRIRGRDASGLGYLSGHAGVAVALGAAAFPRQGWPAGRQVQVMLAGTSW